MELSEIKKEIEETGYLTNIKIGCIFYSKYPKLYNKILEITSSLNDGMWSNRYLRARIIFIFKYNLDKTLISNDKGWYTFDRKKDDFIDKTGDYVKKGWENSKKYENDDFFNLTETISILKKNDYYKKFLGKSKNRTLITENIKLYHSIYNHTKFMDIFDKNNNKFSMRIFFLAEKNGDPNKIKCKKCEKKFTSFNYKINDYNENCKVCFFTLVDHYPTKGYFKKKFGDEWEKYYKKDRETIPNLKVNSKEWFKGKFGEELGIKKYEDFLEKKIKKLENLKTKKYSKISQKLFWLIYEKLNPEEKEKCWFKELNKELYIKVNQTKYYFPDFLMGEKIIEYDGKYWHNQNEDNLRNYLYNQNGFEVMVITEDDFSRETKNNEVVYKCLKFLRNET